MLWNSHTRVCIYRFCKKSHLMFKQKFLPIKKDSCLAILIIHTANVVGEITYFCLRNNSVTWIFHKGGTFPLLHALQKTPHAYMYVQKGLKNRRSFLLQYRKLECVFIHMRVQNYNACCQDRKNIYISPLKNKWHYVHKH